MADRVLREAASRRFQVESSSSTGDVAAEASLADRAVLCSKRVAVSQRQAASERRDVALEVGGGQSRDGCVLSGVHAAAHSQRDVLLEMNGAGRLDTLGNEQS